MDATRLCSIDGCGRPKRSRGWCNMHYTRWRKFGDIGPAGPREHMKDNPCAVDSCVNDVGDKGARGFCGKHYRMWKTTGDPCGSSARSDAERFWPKVDKLGPSECWEWIAALDPGGYGVFKTDISYRAHRWSYLTLMGPIPNGLVLDHLCRNPSCVNPSHLEPVTNDENLERGWGRRIKTGWINSCKNDHEFTSENTYINTQGSKICRRCMADSRARYEQRKKAA